MLVLSPKGFDIFLFRIIMYLLLLFNNENFMWNELIGYISIIITIIVWWTWLIFSRKSSNKLNNPFLENFLITIWAIIFNILVFIWYYIYYWNISFEWIYFLYPLIWWIAWSFAWLFAFISISKIWAWKAFSIWAPSWMVVSFLWWVLYYWEFSSSLIYAILAIITIILWVSLVIQSRNKKDDNKIVFSWVLFALAASLIWWWTYLVPLKELSWEISIFYTLFPLSIWMLLGSFLIYLIKQKLKWLNIDNIKIGLPIIISWFMWWIWNFFAIIAVMNIWMWKAYPMAELCWVVNALFAVYFLKEIKEKSKIKIFLLWTLISFSWAIWLSILKI